MQIGMHALQEFGVKLDLGPEGAAECLDKAGITFMFAPRFHPAMKAVVPVRRSLKVRTAFNVLGPMLNPAGAKYALVGVFNTALARLMAEALQVRWNGELFCSPMRISMRCDWLPFCPPAVCQRHRQCQMRKKQT